MPGVAAAILPKVKDNQKNHDCLLPPQGADLWAACALTEQLIVSSVLSRKHSRHREGRAAHLGVLEDVHDEDGETQAKDVGSEAGVEVGVGVLLQAAGRWERRLEASARSLDSHASRTSLSYVSFDKLLFFHVQFIPLPKWESHKAICK